LEWLNEFSYFGDVFCSNGEEFEVSMTRAKRAFRECRNFRELALYQTGRDTFIIIIIGLTSIFQR